MVSAVVLAGGRGTRLRRVVPDCPKVLAPVSGRPFLHYLLERLAEAGVRTAIVCTGHGAEQVAAACGDGSLWGLRLVYSVEARPLGTAGALKHAERFIPSSPFFVHNGDSCTRADLRRLLRGHLERAARITLLLSRVSDRGRFASVELSDTDAVRRFDEKRGAGPGLASAGVYVVERDVLSEIPEGRACSLESAILPSFIGRGLYGFTTDASFLDIGTPESYADAPRFFAAGGEP